MEHHFKIANNKNYQKLNVDLPKVSTYVYISETQLSWCFQDKYPKRLTIAFWCFYKR